jgi:predicted  nucleic acid-binding Zn-ribbon protein
MLVESGAESPRNVTRPEIETAIMMSRVKDSFDKKIDGMLKLYYRLAVIPIDGNRLFVIDGICGDIRSFQIGFVDLKSPFIEKLTDSSIEPDPQTLRELLKTGEDAFLDFEHREHIIVRGLVDPDFRKGIHDWAIHGVWENQIPESFLVPYTIKLDDPVELQKKLRGMANALTSIINGTLYIITELKSVASAAESKISDSISAINLSPTMEEQRKKLLDRIKALGAERDRNIREAEAKLRTIQNSLSAELSAHIDRISTLSQDLRGAETQFNQLTEEEEYSRQNLENAKRRLATIEDSILNATRKLREVELSNTETRRKRSNDRGEANGSNPTDQKNTQEGSKGSAMETKLEGDFLAEKVRQKDQTVEKLSLEITRLNILLPQVKAEVNELEASHRSLEQRLQSAKEELERARRALDEATKEKLLASEHEALQIAAIRDSITEISQEFQTKIDAVLKQVSMIDLRLKEEEYQLLTLKREIKFRIEKLMESLTRLTKLNQETQEQLFQLRCISLPVKKSEPFEVLLPFYLVLSRESSPRYKIFFPSYVSKLSKFIVRQKLLEKNVKNSILKGILSSRIGNSIIGKLLRYSGASSLYFTTPEGFEAISRRFAELLERNVEISDWVSSALMTSDLLGQQGFFDEVNAGLQKLEAEGTFSRAEVSEVRNWVLEIIAV